MPKIKLNKFMTDEITLLLRRGNAVETVAKIVGVPVATVDKLKENMAPELYVGNSVADKDRMVTEQIEDFERIVLNKKDSITKGGELWAHMKGKHEDYKSSWEADSVIGFTWPRKFVGVSTVADFHIGHDGVDYARLEKDLTIIENNKHMYMAFLGDSIDNFIDPIKHQEAVINATTSPKEQLYMLLYLFNKIVSRPKSKILLATKDNHVTARNKKATGIDWSNKLWSDLGVFYGGHSVTANLKVGDINYRMICRHKYKGGSEDNLTAACKRLLRKGRDGDADIVALAHTHEGAIEVFPYRGVQRVAMQASTYKLYDSYAAELGYDVPVVNMPTVILSPFNKEYIVVSDLELASKMLTLLNDSLEKRTKKVEKPAK